MVKRSIVNISFIAYSEATSYRDSFHSCTNIHFWR